VRILVTGSRDWPYPEIVWQELNKFLADEGYLTVVHGDADGADSYAKIWVARTSFNRLGVRDERHPADWAKHGKAAGPIRNQEMVDLGADLCLAFSLNRSRGTADCLNRAAAAGIERRVLDLRIR